MSFSEPQHIALDAVHASPQPTALLRAGWSGGVNGVPVRSGVSGSRRVTDTGWNPRPAPDRSKAFEGVFRRLCALGNTRVAGHLRAWRRGGSPAA